MAKKRGHIKLVKWIDYGVSVDDLKKILNDYEGDGTDVVILSKDGEGNRYSPLTKDYNKCMYAPDSTCSGEIGLEKLSKEDVQYGYTDDDVITDGVHALVLYPIN